MNRFLRPARMVLLAVLALVRLAADTALDPVQRLRAAGSHAQALKALQGLATNTLSRPDQRRYRQWLHEASWRSQGDNLRNEETEAAIRAIDADFPQDAPEADRDVAWADAQESLGDLHHRRGDPWDWRISRYGLALGWWASQSDLDIARSRYLGIVWKLSNPGGHNQPRPWQAGWPIPSDWIQNAVRIARDPADVAHARLLRALAFRQYSPPDERALYAIEDDFRAAIDAGRGTDWLDDALTAYGQWLEGSGRLVLHPEGGWSRAGDAPRALEIYHRIVAEFAPGASAFRPFAEQRIAEILRAEATPIVRSVFLPSGGAEFSLVWRNTQKIRWSLTPVDLPKAIQFGEAKEGLGNWIGAIRAGDRRPAVQREFSTGDDGSHNPGETNLVLEPRPAPGAYLLQVEGDSTQGRELLLISDAALTLRTSGRTVLAWFTDAVTGRPIPEAPVRLWHQYADRNNPRLESQTRDTDSNGIAEFTLESGGGQIFASAGSGGRQSFAQTWSTDHLTDGDEWKFYAVTDRPAYRPEDTVHWKVTARHRVAGTYRTPVDGRAYFEILDNQGAVLTNGPLRFNAFGSAWGDLALSPKMALGPCEISFWSDAGKKSGLGQATLFRLEEYKLPEFSVKVRTPEETRGGVTQRRAFRLGETVEIDIAAEYFYGGPVANADVELRIRESSWHPWFPRNHEYPWLHESKDPEVGGRFSRGNGDVRREVLKTDAQGHAVFRLETNASGNDTEYQVEARVVDASKREVRAEGQVRVTHQRYFATATALRRVPRPGDSVPVEFRARDANDQPVSVPGQIRVVRQTWTEVWTDPSGRDVSGAALEKARRAALAWPPPPDRNGRVWKLRRRDYEREEVATESRSTDTNGLAPFTFRPAREGYYTVEWSSPGNATAPTPPDNRPRPFEPAVTASAAVWVCTAGSTGVGYHREAGLEILIDRESFRAGAPASLMIATDAPDRWVLLTVDAGGQLSHQVLHVLGTARLVELALDERHVPNAWLSAVGVWQQELHVDTREAVIPPVSHFLSVEVTPETDVLRPHSDGRYRITTRDSDGKPVRSEVSFSVADEAVFQIGRDPAGDPRPFFFGEKRGATVSWTSPFQSRPYRRLERETDPETSASTGRREERERSRNGPMRHKSDLAERRFTVGAPMALDRAEFAAPASMAAPSMAMAMRLDEPGVAREHIDGLVAEKTTPGTVQVRSDFRDTAFWQPDVQTGADGSATVTVSHPDATTRWIATARAATTGSRFGLGTNSVRTRLPLIVRLQTPRFLVVGDVASVSAVLVNNTDGPMEVKPSIDLSGAVNTGKWVGGELIKIERAAGVTVPAHGEVTESWAVTATGPGPVRVKVSAVGPTAGDAMERKLPALEHGIERFAGTSVRAASGDATASLVLPRERKPGTTRFTVEVTPSLAATLLDALPYLADYPYGCTEQTLSRFLPAVIVRKTLGNFGLDAETALARTFGGIETNAASATHPGGKKDLNRLDAMTTAGLERLADFQHEDGGWGWWKEGSSEAWMTAYAVWGLTLARNAGVPVAPEVLARGVDWLRLHLVELENDPATAAWALHALGAGAQPAKESPEVTRAVDRLLKQDDALTPYGRALLALALHGLGRESEARRLVVNLENGVIRNDAADPGLAGTGPAGAPVPTAHWGRTDGWHRWSEGAVETTATVLRALLAVDPKHSLALPAATWLQRNRRGAQWNNTRDTALVVLALNDWLRVTGEARPDLAYEVEVNGRSLGSVDVTGRPLWEIRREFPLEESQVAATNTVRIRRKSGSSPIHLSVRATWFSTEEPITAGGHELFVRRDYFRLVPRETLLRGTVLDRVPLRDGGTVKAGERLESVITLETKNDAEYLLLEDLKPAGFEAVEVQSGGTFLLRPLKKSAVTAAPSSGRRDPGEYADGAAAAHAEWRDRAAAFFIDRLGEGFWELRCEFRAETAGRFHALPVLAEAMYVPELRANGDEVRVVVGD